MAKFKIGDTVYVKGKIIEILKSSGDINIFFRTCGEDWRIWARESELTKLPKGRKKNG